VLTHGAEVLAPIQRLVKERGEKRRSLAMQRHDHEIIAATMKETRAIHVTKTESSKKNHHHNRQITFFAEEDCHRAARRSLTESEPQLIPARLKDEVDDTLDKVVEESGLRDSDELPLRP
jgi:hypothetical protein